MTRVWGRSTASRCGRGPSALALSTKSEHPALPHPILGSLGPQESPMHFPQLVVSRDGTRALVVESIDEERYPAQNRDGTNFDGAGRLTPEGHSVHFQFFVSGTLSRFWDHPNQTDNWGTPFTEARLMLAMIALGERLDADEVATPPRDQYAARVELTSHLLERLKGMDGSPPDLASYAASKIYWGWRFGTEPTRFEDWEARRLGVTERELRQAAFVHLDDLWTSPSPGIFQAKPALIRRQEAVASGSDAQTEFEVALSFAGEQREYVRQVAHHLKQAGVQYFFDEEADLWGKELTVALGDVYRHGSRYVVIFVSEEYVSKAWPNHERQEALAGRVLRMDDSVLPARIHPVDLPGLPPSISYLDVSNMDPAELASEIVKKVRG